LHDRRDLLGLEAAALSATKAYGQAKVTPKDIDLFELHDAFTIMSVLSLEACGFAERGRGVRLGTDGDIAIAGQIPFPPWADSKRAVIRSAPRESTR